MRLFQLTKLLALVITLSVGVLAQTTSAPKPPPEPAPAKTPVAPEPRKLPAPQVVTIVHRLNGVKMFRLLLRSERQLEAIANLNETFSLLEDVHTNVIAGLAMDDGQTVAAWLPEAEIEFGLGDQAFSPEMKSARAAAAGKEESVIFDSTKSNFRRGFDTTPDLTVIDAEGKSFNAEYVGLDAMTGLSILRLPQKNVREREQSTKSIDVGEQVRMFGPEPAAERVFTGRNMYVRMGATFGTIRTILKAPTGGIAKFRVASPRLSAQNVGGVVLNETGDTVGIIDGISGNEASILPTPLIQRAVKRVLEKQASVPRPWLGVKGEAIADLRIDELRNHGWQTDEASLLAGDHNGILLTSIVPGSPAALAALRAGDVILKVNEEVIKDADEFSWILEQSEPSSSLTFTVARPNKPIAQAFNIKLSQKFAFPPFPPPNFGQFASGPGLIQHGIEAIALKAPATTRLGVRNGLLVVYVQPFSAASDAGLKAGDVIQSINGKLVNRPAFGPFKSISTLEVVRKKEKLTLTLTRRG
jgi:S1-C subfamily serine protease